MREIPKWAGKLEHRERDTKEYPDRLGKKIYKILKEMGTEWKGARAVASDRERWKVLCKACTPTDRKGSPR